MHEGHRERLYTRFIENDESLGDVEILELLLCYSISRKDVKPIALRLIEYFGSLYSAINASEEDLLQIDGIGSKTVAFFKVLKKILVNLPLKKEDDVKSDSVAGTAKFFSEYFKTVEVEQMVIALLNTEGEVIKKFVFTDFNRSEINVSLRQLAGEIAKISPHSAVMAHNHFSGNVNPSEADDITTKRIAIMLNVQGVNLYDHLIFCGDEYYSYHISGRLQKIKDEIRSNY